MTAPLPDRNDIRIAVIGLGYVGLPLAAAFGRRYPTVGFDIDATRIEQLRRHHDHTLEMDEEELRASVHLQCTSDPADLAGCDVFIVTVPTPIDEFKRPDLRPLESASRTVGAAIARGGVAIFESTVYPGATEEVCVPIIERESGLRYNEDFYAGYSPERINPGDKEHRLENILKVTSGSTPEAADFIDALYASVVTAGTHKASSIRVAEAAKVIENTQRDVNIALINELALIFARLGIDTHEVLEAAGTKWNFLPFRPGLVGGHCIGVDPYYLTYKAEQAGYHSQIILSGRRINDGMGRYVAENLVKCLIRSDRPVKNARVAILGFTFKENCPDTRNTRVIDVINELKEYGISALVADPEADAREALEEYGLTFTSMEGIRDMDAVVLAVAHDTFRELSMADIGAFFNKGQKVLLDLKGMLDRDAYEQAGYLYWRL